MKDIYMQLNKGGIMEIHQAHFVSGQFAGIYILINDGNSVSQVELDKWEVQKLSLVLQKILLDNLT